MGILIILKIKKMRNIYIIIVSLFVVATLSAQEEMKYRRSSIYSICICHDAQKYTSEISDVFVSMPTPDKYNNHDLNIKLVSSMEKKEEEADIAKFLESNNVARRLVGLWFNRDIETGECDIEKISERGLYDADYFDVQLSKQTIRGEAMLKDAGEDLIQNTFVLVNDIRYVDKQQSAKVASGILKGLGAIAGMFFGSSISDLTNTIGDAIEDIRGFRVIVTSYLYQLEWNDEVAGKFYNDYYIAKGESNPARVQAFNEDNNTFKLKYIGVKKVDSGEASYAGCFEPIDMIRKVCTRSIDKSVLALQRTYEQFQVKTPIYSVDPEITAKIGMKEGITDASRYEVLEKYLTEDGLTEYKRVGVIKPVPGKIWDNRYMATEENTLGSDLTATSFTKVSGRAEFLPGMLIREIK